MVLSCSRSILVVLCFLTGSRRFSVVLSCSHRFSMVLSGSSKFW